jgi:hypothetical protein
VLGREVEKPLTPTQRLKAELAEAKSQSEH